MTRPNDPRPGGEWYGRPRLSGDETAAAPAPQPQRRPPPTVPRYGQPQGGYHPPQPLITPWYQRPAAPPAPIPPAHTPSTRPILIGAAVAAVLLIVGALLVSGVSRLRVADGKVLDASKVQAGVLRILSDPASGYGANTVSEVSCNNGRNPSAAKGATFTCDVIINGTERQVTIVVSDDDGTYEIGRPRSRN